MNVVALVGSLREESFNLQLVQTIAERYQSEFEVTVADIASLPHFTESQEANLPESVTRLQQQVKAADAVIIATPEYNWSIPGVLKNALDWLSRGERVMNGKPALPVGVSPFMMGTIRAQKHLRDILDSPGIAAKTLVPGGNEILITFARDKFDDTRRLVDESTLQFIDQVMTRFLALARS
ncbi:NAD(P)H-dependent oxidoreductase [Alicyclobacillus curvatus]|jgi:chromate reductase, NAD(P)H dehydrogenase (quinone)|nr:NAD(P)H-dependent oxidoreductase [Alicyclobacillus curvatus]